MGEATLKYRHKYSPKVIDISNNRAYALVPYLVLHGSRLKSISVPFQRPVIRVTGLIHAKMKVSFPSLVLSLSIVFVCSFVLTSYRASPQTNSRIESQGRQLHRDGEIKVLPSKNKRWALVIGVDDYSDAQITKLSGASNDAHKVADALTKYAGFPEDQVILLASDQPPALQPRRSTILRFLSNLRGTVPKDGLLLVSFAGHGIERGGRAFLLPSDALGVNDMVLLEDTAVSVDRIKDSIRATGVGQVILILDACRSDPASGRSGGDNLMTSDFRKSFNFDQQNRDIRAFATLYATAVGERSYEYDVKKQGYFTWALVEGLRGAAANDRGEVTLQRLVDYLQNNVPRLVQRDLGIDKKQQPFATVEGYLAADLVIAFAPPGATSSSTPAPAAFELSYWESIKSSSDPHDFEAYLQKYPNGQFVELARNNLSRLKARSNNNGNPQFPGSTRDAKAGKILLNVTLKQEGGNATYDADLTATFLDVLSSVNLDVTDISSVDTKTRTRLLSNIESLRGDYGAVISRYELIIDAELVLNQRVVSGADGMFIANVSGLLRIFDCAIGRAVITKNLSLRGFGLNPNQAITNAKRNVREGLTEEVLAKIADYAGPAEQPAQRQSQKVHAESFTFELGECAFSGSTATCELMITNHDIERQLKFMSNTLFDDLGKAHGSRENQIGNSGRIAVLVSGVATRARVTFSDIPTQVKGSPLLTFGFNVDRADARFGGGGRSFKVEFRNVALKK